MATIFFELYFLLLFLCDPNTYLMELFSLPVDQTLTAFRTLTELSRTAMAKDVPGRSKGRN